MQFAQWEKKTYAYSWEWMEVPPSGQAGLSRFTDIIVYSNNNIQTDFNTNLSLILIYAVSEEKLCRREGIYTESWPVKEMPRC